jgi:hypothetical protein
MLPKVSEETMFFTLGARRWRVSAFAVAGDGELLHPVDAGGEFDVLDGAAAGGDVHGDAGLVEAGEAHDQRGAPGGDVAEFITALAVGGRGAARAAELDRGAFKVGFSDLVADLADDAARGLRTGGEGNDGGEAREDDSPRERGELHDGIFWGKSRRCRGGATWGAE